MENYSKPLHVPEDITNKILIRLPLKSLLRFTLVSKSWMNHIQSHEFTQSRINNRRKHHLIFSSRRGSFHSTHDRREEAVVDLRRMILSTTAPMHLDRHNIIGHCNGIICLARNEGQMNKTILLWNPYLRQCRRIRLRLYSIFHWYFAGFGYDSKNQDYKVVLCSTDRNNYIMDLLRYSLKTDTWRNLSPGRIKFAQSDYYSGCLCFEGKLHWIRKPEDAAERHVKSVVIFNMADDKFAQFAMPVSSPDEEGTGSSLGVFRGRLSFIKRKYHFRTEEFEIWSTTDPTTPTSWMKALSISPTGLSLKRPFLRPMGLDKWRSCYYGLASDGKVLVQLSVIPDSVSVELPHNVLYSTVLNSNVRLDLSGRTTRRVVEHEFISTECALLYDAEAQRLKVYQHDANADFTWYAITDYLESFVSVKSNPGWGKFGNYVLSGRIMDPKEFIGPSIFVCFLIIVFFVLQKV